MNTYIFAGIRVFQGGGNEVMTRTLKETIEEAAESSLKRMYPLFAMADNPNWEKVITRARGGENTPLSRMATSRRSRCMRNVSGCRRN